MPFAHAVMPQRVFRVCFGDNPLALPPLKKIQALNGRFDDPEHKYRVLYTASSMTAAFIEILAPLRPRASAYGLLRTIRIHDEADELEFDFECVIKERLRERYAALLLVPTGEQLVDILAAQSRTVFEQHLELRGVKVGDFIGKDLKLPQRISRYLFAHGHNGIVVTSAEALAVGYTEYNYAIFELRPGNGSLRIHLEPRCVSPAMDERIALAEAVDILGLKRN